MSNVYSAALVARGNIRVKKTRFGLMLYNIHDPVAGRARGHVALPRVDYAKAALGDGADAGTEQVMVIPIDELNLQQCHVIRLAANGEEQAALAGAAATIAKLRPILYVGNDRRDNA